MNDMDDDEVMFALTMACEHDKHHQAVALRTWLPRIKEWRRDLEKAKQVVAALSGILPLAENYMNDAPGHPDQAKLEDARAALFRAHGIKRSRKEQDWTKRIYKCGCTANGAGNVPLECPEHGAPIRRETDPGRTDP